MPAIAGGTYTAPSLIRQRSVQESISSRKLLIEYARSEETAAPPNRRRHHSEHIALQPFR